MKDIISNHMKIISNTLLLGSGTSLLIGTTFRINVLSWIASLLLISWYICINKYKQKIIK